MRRKKRSNNDEDDGDDEERRKKVNTCMDADEGAGINLENPVPGGYVSWHEAADGTWR
jgi:hypothetical protein